MLALSLHFCEAGRGNEPTVGDDRGQTAHRPHDEDSLARAAAAYEDIARRFGSIGGLERVFALFEQIRLELDRVEFAEIDASSRAIKAAVETLLRMDYELRKLNNLKVAIGAGERERE